MSTESVMPSNRLILCDSPSPALIFPSIRVFSSELALHIRYQSIEASASVLPMNVQTVAVPFHPGLATGAPWLQCIRLLILPWMVYHHPVLLVRLLCGAETAAPQGFTVCPLPCSTVMCLCWKQNGHEGLLSQRLGKHGIYLLPPLISDFLKN